MRRREGVLIAGGGVAGCLAALALAKLRPDVPLLIVEEQERFGGDRYRFLFQAELAARGRALIEPLIEQSWPGFYVAFPDKARNLKAPLVGFSAGALHQAMVEALEPNQYRLGTRIDAVREDALVLEGGETVRAQGAIDARGAANLSMLDLLFEARIERLIRLDAPHGLERPVLIDAAFDQGAGLSYAQAFPVDQHRLRVACLLVSERAQPDDGAGARLDRYLERRGWEAEQVDEELTFARPLPLGGDFAAFWRIGGARVAKLGLRGGFLQPATGRSVGDAVATALSLADQQDFSGSAIHDLFEGQARELWRRREIQRSLNARIAAAALQNRGHVIDRLYGLEPGLITRFHADQLGLLDRRRIQRMLREVQGPDPR